MIREDYCCFEVAKLLKEKGFNWECRTVYKSNSCIHDNVRCEGKWLVNSSLFPFEYSAPTHQMAMKWLRERQIDIVVFHERLPEDCYWARIEKYPYTEHQQEPIYQTYEEAVEAALKYTLENLI